MKSIRKFDAVPKLNGSWRFLDDYSYPDMIFGQLLYSTCHHGLIKEIRFPKDYDLKDFTIVSARDIPGKNSVPNPTSDQLFLAENEVSHFGQPILGIAHPKLSVLKEFIKKIEVDYEELPAITDIKQCLDNEENTFGKEIVIDHRNGRQIQDKWLHHHRVYYTQHQEQAYLETQGMIAVWNENQKSMFVKGTLQCPFFVKSGVEAIMGSSVRNVEIETSEGIGGAFGGKEDFPSLLAGITALLSYKSGRPVKIVLGRSDDIQITTKRHPSRVEIHSWTDPKTNKIEKIEIDYRLDAGYFETLSPVVLSRGVLHAIGGYAVPDSFIRGRLMRSNTPPNGAFRGFGAPQAFTAVETHIDNIAAEMNIDPLTLRQKNLLHIGSELPSTQIITEDHLSDCLNRVIEKSDYYEKAKEFIDWNRTHKDKKGIGISIGYHGGGYTGNGEKVLNSEIKVVITKDAVVEIYVANTDMGQGAHTTLVQMFCEAIDHPDNKCRIILPNTNKTPNSGPTVASRTIYIIGNMLHDLALELKNDWDFEKLEDYVTIHQNEFPREIKKTFQPDPYVQFDEETYQGTGYKDYSWAACVTEIYYHADTYKVELIKNWSVLDVGRLANPKIALGQAEGGIVQGLAYGLSEFFYKPGFGRMHGFTDYTLPTSLDIPKIEVEFIHTDSDIAKGLGEIPMDFPAPSVRNAVQFALGIPIDEYPLTAERIFKSLTTDKHR